MRLPSATHLLLGFNGPRHEAEEIKRQIGKFLHDELKLKLSESKTLLTSARTEPARFLGYEVGVLQVDHKLNDAGHRSFNGTIGLRVPAEVVRAKCVPYLDHGEPIHRMERSHDAPFSIVAQYQAEYQGAVEYYRFAYNLHIFSRLHWTMERSLTKTLARKLRISVPKVIERFRATAHTDNGPRKVLQVTVEREGKAPLVAQWGGVALKRRMDVVLNDQPKPVWNVRTELLERLLADTCELCGSQEDVEVHHIRALKDLRKKGRAEVPNWVKLMAARRRKTLVVCHQCHEAIHDGRLRRPNRLQTSSG